MLFNLFNALKRYAGRPAFFIDGRYFSYSQLDHLSARLSFYLSTDAFLKEPLIGVLLKNNIKTYASILGVLFAGKGFVPIHPDLPAERILSIIRQAGIKTIVTSSIQDAALNLGSATLVNFDQLEDPSSGTNDAIALDVEEDTVAYIMFTSGSTGKPKGVPITHKNLSAFSDSFFDCTPALNEHDRVLQMFELTFDFSISAYLLPLTQGACVCCPPAQGIKHFEILDYLTKAQITVTPMVPSVINLLRPYFDQIHLPRIKHAYFCGEALYLDVINGWKKCLPNAVMQNFYGPTEATVFSTEIDCKDAEAFNGVVSIGRPMRNVEAIIVDEKLNIVSDGEKGDLCLTGDHIMAGYWNLNSMNKTSFFVYNDKMSNDIYYRTGDRVFKSESGDLFFCGRIDLQVQVQGYRVELGEIETLARKLAFEVNTCAVTIKNAWGNDEIHLFLEAFFGEIDAFTSSLKVLLPDYMGPVKVHQLESFPLNKNGKIDREVLCGFVEETAGKT